MHENSLLSERLSVVGVLDPASPTAGTRSTGWIAAADYFTSLAIISVGATAGAVTINVDQATDSAGTGSTVLKTVAVADTDDNKQYLIDIRSKELTQPKTHFRVRIVAAVDTSFVSVVVLGGDRRYGRPESNNVASAASITH